MSKNNDDIIYLDPEKGSAPVPFGPDDAIKDLWSKGILYWKLDDTQKEMYDGIKNAKSQKYVINASRRLGKSYLLCVLAIEFAMQHPGSRICYAAPTAKAVKKIITPIIKEILLDCPKELKPKWKAQDQVYEFHNGSELHIAGTDAERAESLRGQSMHLGLVDEAGFMTELDYVVSDILMPQTLTTDGTIVIASTPPKSPSHDFKQYARDAEIRGDYMKKTIYDNPRLTKKKIVKWMKETDVNLTDEEAEAFYQLKAGPNNSTWQREYMAEFMTDEKSAVIPEFNNEAQLEIIREEKRPAFFDAYVSMDIGMNDFTVVLFGYYHFEKAILVIEDEVVMNQDVGMTTTKLAQDIAATEMRLWGEKKPYLRYSDTDLIVISDLQKLHGITFIPTKKDNKEAQINFLREMVRARRIAIHPKCTTLISHLKDAVWNKQRTAFERSSTQNFGHFDAVDALIYMIRNVQQQKNPVPPGYGLNPDNQFINNYDRHTKSQTEMKKMIQLSRFFTDWGKK